MVFAVQLHELIAGAGAQSFPISPYKRGVTGSNPVAPTRQNAGGLIMKPGQRATSVPFRSVRATAVRLLERGRPMLPLA
jgi:hypothetical protein